MSVRKRTWKTRKGEEKSAWVLDYFATNPTTGKRERILKTFQRKKDAEAFRDEAGHEIREGTHTPASKSITVRQAGDLWVKEAEDHDPPLEDSTIRQWRGHLKKHINPAMGDVKLNDLTAPMVKKYETWLRDNDRSPAMVRKVITSLGALVAEAQEHGYINRNVVRERPKKRRNVMQAKRRKTTIKSGKDYPAPSEIQALLSASAGTGRPIIATAVFTGMRLSELRGLTWENVDLDKKVIHVRQRADEKCRLGPPKSAAGRRDIPIGDFLTNTLKEWKLKCPPSELGLVFPTGKGTVQLGGNLYRRVFMPAWVAAGVTVATGEKDKVGKPTSKAKYNIHALRHAYASRLLGEKDRGGMEISPKRAQALLGHSSFQMTMDTYGHLLPARDDESAEFTAAEMALVS